MTEPTRDTAEFTHDLADTYLLGQVGRSAALGAEYQRQQLNLLREARGLPPIPPPQPVNYVGNIGRTLWQLFLVCVALGLIAWVVIFLATVALGNHNP